MARFPLRSPIGTASLYRSKDARAIAETILFDRPSPLYVGAAGRSVRFVGARTDAQAYVGARRLF